MKKYCFFMLVVFLVLTSSSFVFSQNETELSYDKTKALDWLSERLEANDWNYAVETISWSILALAVEGYDYSEGISKLKSIRNGDNNWNGDVFETAIATMAMDKVGEDVNLEIDWLIDQQQKNLAGGRWLIQFNPLSQTTSGNCRLIYGDNEVMVDLDGYNITTPGGCYLVDDSWVDFKLCVKGTDPDMYEEIFVDCSSPSGQISSSLLYKVVETSGNSYYIVDETYQDQLLEIRNGCYFGKSVGCNCDYTGYAGWILSHIGEGTNFYGLPYLKSRCNDNVLHNIFLYLLTSGTSYMNWFEQIDNPYRNNDGSWSVQSGSGADLSQTAMVVLSLKGSYSGSGLQAVQWLKNKQRMTDGSWEQNPKLTAQILYALSSGYIPPSDEGVNVCGDGIIAGNEQCESIFDCTAIDPSFICSNSCMCVESSQNCADLGTGECVPGVFECSTDETCNPITCLCEIDSIVDDTPIPTTDDEESSNWLTWLIFIFVLSAGIVIIYYVYMKYFKGKQILNGKFRKSTTRGSKKSVAFPKTSQKVPNRSFTRKNDRIENKVEKELDEALRKAKDLLKK